MIASRRLSEYWGRCRTARFRCDRPTYGLCLRSRRPRANDCAVAHFDIVRDVASGTGLSPDEAGQSTRSRQSCRNWPGTGCDCNHRRSISEKLLAWSSLARCPPSPSRRATGPTGRRQELEAVNRWRWLRRFWRRCFGNPRFGTTVGRFIRCVAPCSAGCARRAGGLPGIAQQATTSRRRRRLRQWQPRRPGILRRHRPVAAPCRG